MKNKNKVIWVLVIIILLLIIFLLAGAYAWLRPATKSLEVSTPVVTQTTDAQRFKAEYPGVADNNAFVYKTDKEMIDILKSGTGLVYFGFPECPWCQKYVTYLDELSRQEKLEKIYYFNIRQIRASTTPEYQEIVGLLSNHLDKDDQGNPRVFVPDVTAVKDGKILFHDNTSSLNTAADGTPDSWWTEERVKTVKEKLLQMIKAVNVCESTCNL